MKQLSITSVSPTSQLLFWLIISYWKMPILLIPTLFNKIGAAHKAPGWREEVRIEKWSRARLFAGRGWKDAEFALKSTADAVSHALT
jgi:hypothetical protein